MARLILAEREGMVVLAGEVTKVTPGKGKVEGRVVEVTVKGTRYDSSKKEEVVATTKIPFWNSKDPEKVAAGKSQMADRITKAKVREGVNLVILAAKREDGTLVGLDFKYSGVFTLQGGKEYEKEDGTKGVTKEMNIISGSVTKAVMDVERGVARITIPTTARDGENTDFHCISVWNSDKNPNAADNAVKYLAPYTKEGNEKPTYKKAIFVCGENTHFGKDPEEEEKAGRTVGNSYTCFRYEFVNSNSSTSAPTSGAPTPAPTQEEPIPVTEEDEDGFIDIPEDVADSLPWEV